MSNAFDTFSDHELLDLIPRGDVADVVGATPDWQVLRAENDVRGLRPALYRTAILVEVNRRYQAGRSTLSPAKAFEHADSPFFANIVGITTEQVIIRGTFKDEDVASLHLAKVFPGLLYLGDICLQHVNAPILRPLMKHQSYPGLGDGIFSKTLANVQALARRMACERVVALAPSAELRDIFLRRGFEIDKSDALNFKRSKYSGSGYPISIRAC